jgi:hypothetical protein
MITEADVAAELHRLEIICQKESDRATDISEKLNGPAPRDFYLQKPKAWGNLGDVCTFAYTITKFDSFVEAIDLGLRVSRSNNPWTDANKDRDRNDPAKWDSDHGTGAAKKAAFQMLLLNGQSADTQVPANDKYAGEDFGDTCQGESIEMPIWCYQWSLTCTTGLVGISTILSLTGIRL